MAVMTPQFRYLDGYKDYVKDLAEEVDEIKQLIEQQKKLLSSAKLTNAQTKLSAAGAITLGIVGNEEDQAARLRRMTRKVDPELATVVIPNQKALKDQYKLVEALYERYTTLENVETQIAIQFPEAAANKLKAEINSCKTQITNSLKDALGFLESIAEHHVPKSFRKYTDVIADEISQHVPSKQDKKCYLYVSVTGNNQICFTFYILIEDAISNDGTITPVVYAIVQWVVGEPVRIYMTHQFVTPNTLLTMDSGIEVNNAGDATRKIGDLLRLEQFDTALGVIPLSLAFLADPKSVNKAYFKEADVIESFSLTTDNVAVFKVKRSVPKRDYPELAKQLYVQIHRLFVRDNRARITVDKSGNPVRDNRYSGSAVRVSYKSINPAQRTIAFVAYGRSRQDKVTLNDIEYMRDRFNLDNKKLNQVLQVMNQ